jgi:hypothetical protein
LVAAAAGSVYLIDEVAADGNPQSYPRLHGERAGRVGALAAYPPSRQAVLSSVLEQGNRAALLDVSGAAPSVARSPAPRRAAAWARQRR